LSPAAEGVPKGEDVVLICRCAWHQRYRGYPLLNGVASWRGWSVRFTDGICETCLERFRAEYQRYLQNPTDTPPHIATAAPTSTEAE
jgi:hypothetical protein